MGERVEISVPVDREVSEALSRLAEAEGRPVEALAGEVIARFVAREDEEAEVREAMVEMDRGLGITSDELKAQLHGRMREHFGEA